MKMTKKTLAGTVVLGLAMLALPTAAFADSLSCEVVEIRASKTDNPSMDPDLKDLKKKLSRAPLNAFNTFKMLSRISYRLELNTPHTYTTAKGETSLTLTDVDRPEKKRARASLDVQVLDANHKRYVSTEGHIDVGDFLFFGLSISETESILTAVGCKE